MKSSPSLKIVEYDVFIMVMPISRQIDTIVESMMFMVTMSMTDAPQAHDSASKSHPFGAAFERYRS